MLTAEQLADKLKEAAANGNFSSTGNNSFFTTTQTTTNVTVNGDQEETL